MAKEERQFAKAKLIELNQLFTKEKNGGQQVEVQFNPESLKVTFANQLDQPSSDQSAGSAGQQFVASSTTKLALQLWFDVNAMEENPVDDVRRLTQKVAYFMTPQRSEADRTKKAPPGVRFAWGSFIFDGMVEGMEETLEFFSPEGKPLRASISMTLSQQKILETKFEGDGKVPLRTGQEPRRAAEDGDSLQDMAAQSGKRDWQSIAAANGIEDPLRMAPGQLVDLNAIADAGAGALAGVARPTLGAGAGASVGRGPNAALGGAASGSLSIG